jgi:glycosyltransferase involved in cell wall biosynthesis
MRIVFLIHSYYKYLKGGAEYQAFLFAKELIKRKHEVHYIFINSTSSEISEQDDGILLHPLENKKISRFIGKVAYRNEILKLLMQIKPDCIYHRNLSVFLNIANTYCKSSDCKTIWHIDSKPDVEMKKLSISKRILVDYFEKKYLEFGIKNANCIIGQEDYHNEMLVRNFGKECTVILNSVLPVEKKQIIKTLPIKVLWIANIKPLKQPEFFMDLAYQFKEDDNASFIMVGRSATGNYQAKLEKRMQRLSNLEYKGELPIDEVNDLLRESHLFVNTSLYEGVPITFIQAWMREVPTVSLNVDPDDMIKKNKLGFHSGSFEQMVEDVRFLIENKKVRGEMGRNARKYALREYDIEKNVPKYVELFERMVKR